MEYEDLLFFQSKYYACRRMMCDLGGRLVRCHLLIKIEICEQHYDNHYDNLSENTNIYEHW